jgi:hypothetical protein
LPLFLALALALVGYIRGSVLFDSLVFVVGFSLGVDLELISCLTLKERELVPW